MHGRMGHHEDAMGRKALGGRKACVVIGLTGSFGTGKTTVAGMLKKLGARVINADSHAHAALAKGSAAYRAVVRAFGADVVGPDGSIDRRRLAHVVFKDKRLLSALCAIIHPLVITAIKKDIRALTRGTHGIRGRAIVIDAPLLIEAGLHTVVDTLVVVTASTATQRARCSAKFKITQREILDRTKNQMPLTKKVEMADYVIDNNGTREETNAQVEKIWRELWK